MDISHFDYELPPHLIAQKPVSDRTSSRLMVMNRRTGELTHGHFCNIINFLQPNDCLVLNNTKVIPARLFGERINPGADSRSKIELLLLNRKDKDIWESLVKPGKNAKTGDKLVFGGGLLTASVVSVLENGSRLLEFSYNGVFQEILDRIGEMPLPPYITEKLNDKNRYQTVYAKAEGSAAAPTAGLHFTSDLLKAIAEKGVKIAYVTLHVGLGTFRPVKVQHIEKHEMHSEYYEIAPEQAHIINEAKQKGGRIIAVGTTSCRTLESTTQNGIIRHGAGFTDIFMYPGYEFKIVDGLITNFHLPKSTLIMLVSAFCGIENTSQAYRTAIDMEYRFFSFGDAMIIV